jgi:hypothetical protein
MEGLVVGWPLGAYLKSTTRQVVINNATGGQAQDSQSTISTLKPNK